VTLLPLILLMAPCRGVTTREGDTLPLPPLWVKQLSEARPMNAIF
jgi:hypothetical protein